MTVAYFGSGATLGVFIDFDAGVTDTPAAWTDVTGDVVIDMPITINRGRSSERDTFQTGTCSFALLNTARKYDPEHSSGTYFGKLLPGRPVKVELTYSGSTSVLFRGFIQGWPQAWEASDNKSVVSIVAHDAFKYLAIARLPESRYYVEVMADTPTAWWRLGDPDTIMRDAATSAGTYTGTHQASSTEADSIVTGTSGARAFTTGGYSSAPGSPLNGSTSSVEFWYHADTLADSAVVWQGSLPNGTGAQAGVTVTNDGRVACGFTKTIISDQLGYVTDPGVIVAGQTYHIVVTKSGTTCLCYVNGQSVTFTSFINSGTIGTSFGELARIGPRDANDVATFTADEVAIYPSALSGARVLAHYTAGSTVNAGEDVDARISQTVTDAGLTWLSTSLEDSQVTVRFADYSIGGGGVLAYLQALERTEQGRIFVAADGTLTFHQRYHDQTTSVAAAFTDVAGGSLPYVECVHEFDDTRVLNDATVSRTNGVAQRYSDATSEGAYGLQSVTIDALQGQSDAECLDIAVATVSRYKDPAARIRALSVKPRANAAGLFPVVRTLDIGSKVTVRRLPLGTGSAFTKTLTVEGVTHSIGIDGEWVTTYLTAPVNANNYLILDDATYGQLDQELIGY